MDGRGAMDDATWMRLRGLAIEAMERAYVPYSGYPVGAAAIVDDGRWVSGCNVENAGYGVTLCAECGLVSDLVRGGGGRLVAFVCVNADGERIVPCGRCRQLLSEHAHEDLLLDMPQGVMTMEQVLPHSFAAGDLAGVENPAAKRHSVGGSVGGGVARGSVAGSPVRGSVAGGPAGGNSAGQAVTSAGPAGGPAGARNAEGWSDV